MKIKIQQPATKKELTIPTDISKTRLNPELISQIYRAIVLNNKLPRHTKIRSERQGGGAKPWRQKGTGRARHGSTRSPIWRKGGVTFGPRKEENFKQKVNQKMKKQAIRSLINKLAEEDKLIVVNKLPTSKKTKNWEKYLSKLPIKDAGQILFVLDKPENQRYLKNIPYVNPINLTGLNVYSILNHDYLIIEQKSIEKLFKNLKN